MGYNPIKASEQSFKDMINYTLNRILTNYNKSLKEIKKDGNILLTYLNDHPNIKFPSNPIDGINNYLKKHINYFTQNLETKKVLENIITSSNLSILKKEEWQTNELEHIKKLNKIKELADTIYNNIDIPFKETENYKKLYKIAKNFFYNSQKQFKTWQNNIDELKKTEIKPAKPYVLAKEIHDIGNNAVEYKDVSKYKEALRALLYLYEEYLDNKISELINKLATADVEKMKCKHKRTFVENLKEIAEFHSSAA